MIAIIAMEEDAASLAGRLAQARQVRTSGVAMFEAAAGLARIANARPVEALAVVEHFLSEIKATVVAIDQATGRTAIETFQRFGKGSHPAALNMGDCFAYACARQLAAPLLCKGNDFPRTDIDLG
ncbi:type II toxin-antitoxin system VapC family toxin [Rhodopila sp.]|uniref:type II toxin-antitoxin system VapC family toxin n=1 Tax=Rhodopila sp. TaxID=2480087 RepID=UPI003D0D6DD9